MALENAHSFINLGAHSVKLEGFHPKIVEALTNENIMVMGHLGLLPQTAKSLTQVGKGQKEFIEILGQAKILEEVGIFSLVLEHLNPELASKITTELKIPTIGIGAGLDVNGQVLVLHDLLGIHNKPIPPFAMKFADIFSNS